MKNSDLRKGKLGKNTEFTIRKVGALYCVAIPDYPLRNRKFSSLEKANDYLRKLPVLN